MATLIPTRFSLKLLLIMVAAISVWLAYQVHWLRLRHDALDWIARHETAGNWSAIDLADVTVSDPLTGATRPDQPRRAPLLVRITGKPLVYFIHLDKSKLSAADVPMLDRLQALFPEASGIHINEPGWSRTWPPPDREAFFAGA